MKQTKAPNSTPSPKQEEHKPGNVVGKQDNPSSVFIGMALDMTWRLAIVVLVPIVGGFELDKIFNTSPIITIVGFIIAMIGMALVLMRMLKVANNIPVPESKEKHS